MVGRISFFVNAGLRFITEMCKMRAFTELWDEITATRYGVKDAKHRLFRYGVQVNSLGLTEQQPENNVYRILIEMLAVTLSKDARARAVQLPAWNEALGLPRPWDQQWSIRMQQILAYETDLLEYSDIFEGSTAIRRKVDELKSAAKAELARIDDDGRRRSGHRHHEAGAGREQHRAAAQDRVRRADRRGRQPLDRNGTSPLAAGEGAVEAIDPAIESRAGGTACRLAHLARRQGSEKRSGWAGERSQRGSQCHGAVDRLRQGGCHDR